MSHDIDYIYALIYEEYIKSGTKEKWDKVYEKLMIEGKVFYDKDTLEIIEKEKE